MKKTKNENLIELESCIKQKLSNLNAIEVCKVKDKVAILFCDVNSNHSFNILNSINKEINKCLKGRIFVTVGQEVSSIDDILLSYNTAKELMKSYIFIFK